MADTNRTLLLVGVATAMAAAGLFAGLALRRARPPETARRRGRKRNPVEFHSTIQHHGVPIYVHVRDGKFCADYRAIDRFAPGQGDVVCARSRDDAERQAKKAINAALGPRPALPPRRTPYPSPWD